MQPRTNPVAVRSRFTPDHWSQGFEVAEVVRQGEQDLYRLRRRSDGAILPVLFAEDEVRFDPARAREVT